jgi:hypothetical protein
MCGNGSLYVLAGNDARAEDEDDDDAHEDHHAFRAYAKIRAGPTIARIAATACVMVKSVNEDGSISRVKPTRDTWLREAFVTAEETEKRRADIEAMNPGSRVTVVAL